MLILNKNKITIFADKTKNIFQTNQRNYKKLLINNLTKTYRISNKKLCEQINAESRETIIDKNTK